MKPLTPLERVQVEHYRAVLDAAGDAMLSGDEQGCITFWSRGAARLFGYSAREMIGKSISRIAPRELRDDQWRMMERVMRSGNTVVVERERVTRHGRRFTAEITISARRPDEEHPRGFVSIVRDVSDRKRTERRLRFTQFTVDQAKLAVFWCYPDGKFFYVNRTACAWLGYSPEELRRMHVADINPEFPRSAWGRHWAQIKAEGMVRMESVHCRKNGEVYPVEIYSNYVSFEGQEFKLAFVHDISDRKHAEEELQLVEEQLRQAQKMEAVGQLAGGIAHDFNNLLQVINGHTELALAELGDHPTLRPDLEEVARAGSRAARLVSQLLAFSRRQRMKPMSLDLNEVLGELTKMLRRVIGEHIHLEFRPADELGAFRGDRGMIEQVVMNLCVNARDAMRGGGRLTLETSVQSLDEIFCRRHAWARPGRFVTLSVIDTGCGMSPESRARIFEPFYTTKEPGQGTGLGLATVYGIVRQHEGIVHVESEPDHGTAFRLLFPAIDGNADAPEAEREEAALGGDETILLAEDEATVRDFTRRILERAGYRVISARDGIEAVELYRARGDEIDLCLLDAVMPNLGGHAAFAAIRRLDPAAPALFASGYCEDALHHGFVLDADVPRVEKPFRRRDLLRAVRRSLDARVAARGGGEEAVP